MEFHGPFGGLVTHLAPDQIPVGSASECGNVLLSEGRIRPRPGIRLHYRSPIGFPGRRIRGLYQWDRSYGTNDDHIVLVVLSDGGLWSVVDNSATQLAVDGSFRDKVPVFVPFNRRVYIANGLRPWRTDGTIQGTTLAGMRDPSPKPRAQVRSDGDNGIGGGIYQYAVTWYDALADTESNAAFIFGDSNLGGAELNVPVGSRIRISFRYTDENGQLRTVAPEPNIRPTHMRIYRRSMTLSDAYWWAIVQIPYPFADNHFEDGLSNDGWEAYNADSSNPNIVAGSNRVTGPFAPTRNGVPPPCRIMAAYKDRMFFADKNDTSRIRFSAVGRPDHVHEDDYESVGGDQNDDIAFLTEYSGNLCIGKTGSIWILSGAIITPTNDTVATDEAVPESYHALHKTKVPQSFGATGEEGPGCIVAGTPQYIYYPGNGGFYRFNGVESEQVSIPIKETWENFASSLTGSQTKSALTFAYDSRNGCLIICGGGGEIRNSIADALVLEMSRMQWSIWTGHLPITAVADSIGSQGRYSPAIMGYTLPDTGGTVAAFDDLILSDVTDLEGNGSAINWTWASGLMDLGSRTHRKHVYLVSWMGTGDGMAFYAVATDADADWRQERNPYEASGLSWSFRRRVSRTGLRFVVGVQGLGLEQRGFAITGFSLDAERVGQR